MTFGGHLDIADRGLHMQIRMKPEVSVIIPAYNGASHICESIESILNQTYKQFEIIVIDDGSTDKTREVLDPYIRNSSIRYYYQNNTGHGAARNTGIKYAQGNYVCFLDQDDWFEKDSLERRLHLYKKYPELGLVCSDFRTALMSNDGNDIVYEESYVKKMRMIERIPSGCITAKDKDFYIINKNFYPEMLLDCCFVWICTAMIRKEVFDDVGPFDEEFKWSPDTDLSIRISRKYSVGYLEASTAIYRRHPGGMSLNLIRLYEDAVRIRIKHMNSRWGLNDRDKRRVRVSIGEYCAYKTRLLIGTKDHFRALNDILKGIKYDPLCLRCYLYLPFAIMPPKVISMLKLPKKHITKVIKMLLNLNAPQESR